MTMNTKIIIVFGALLCVAANIVVKHAGLPEAKVTVRVVDEAQTPISGVNVRLGFQDKFDPRKDIKVQGLTDNEGLFIGQGGSDSVVGSSLRMQGYYNGSAPIPTFHDADEVSYQWLPWNPTIVTVLRKIDKPIPMCAKRAWVEIPVIGEPCGYDLAVGDWVVPYGQGQKSDLVFKLKREYETRQKFNVSVDISFSNEGDGIQSVEIPKEWKNSDFIWPRFAPESGYEPTLNAHFMGTAGSSYQGNVKDDQMYFFRVRTVKRNNQIFSALYGKIRGGLKLAPMDSKTCEVQLTYYLNPTSLDRNMEWDQKQNLLKGLSWEETPRDP